MKKIFLLLLQVVFVPFLVIAQSIPTPKEHFGFSIGEPYQLANFTQTEAYFMKVAALSDRVQYRSIGQTEFGREQPLLVITAPKNFPDLERYQEISRKLGRAVISEAEAKALANQGKPIVWIDGGLHASEVVGAQQLIETLYTLASKNDEETLRILDEVIILLVHVNPDGMEIMSNWYMRPEDKAKRNKNIPVLYQSMWGTITIEIFT